MVAMARRAYAVSARPSSARRTPSRPMSEMNVTPFIDVLLVLIIMLIMVVPIATHITEIDLPGPCVDCTSNADGNTVAIDASDRLFWNGEQVSPERLSLQVAHASRLPEEPTLRFDPDAHASYNASAKTITLIKDAGAKNFAFVGNHRHKAFAR